MTHIKASMLRHVSNGIVANNKLPATDEIEVTPIEHLPFVDGQITDSGTSVTASGTDASGAAYSTQLASSITVKAKWLRRGAGNRVTAPDVRRGATVALYQFGDVDRYYWETLTDDSDLRKLETVVHAYSGTQEESAKTDATNSYYHEVSTHQGLVALHTSAANGEFTTYDIQINAKEGYFRLQDGVGNALVIDSTRNLFQYTNADGSILQVLGNAMQFIAPQSIGFRTKVMTVEADQSFSLKTPQSNIQSTTTHNGDFTENGALDLNGNMATAAGDGGNGGTAGTGQITIAGNMQLEGNAAISGTTTTKQLTSEQPVIAPNV